jgi:nuclear pore complex protein Nup205
MSMFIQIAQTVSGAERLVDVGIVPILAKCDYLDSRPESDHSFMGNYNHIHA